MSNEKGSEKARNCGDCRFGGRSCPILPCNGCYEGSEWKETRFIDVAMGLTDEELIEYISGIAAMVVKSCCSIPKETDLTVIKEQVAAHLRKPVELGLVNEA